MRIRLILSFTLIILVSVGAMAWLASQGAAREVRTFMMRGGMVGATDLVDELEAYYQAHQTWDGVEALLLPRRGQGHGPGMMMSQRMRLADASGAVVYDSSPGARARLSENERAQAIQLRSERSTAGYLLLEGGAVLTTVEEQALMRRLTSAALLASLIAGGVGLLLALVLSHRLLRPVNDLTRAAGRMAQGDLSQRVAVHGRDEIGRLGQTFNSMASALHQAEQSRRAMTADIAHELRNPLAVQRAHLEALVDGVYPLQVENLEPVLEQNRTLERLVEDLRTLALADAGQLDLQLAATDLPWLAERVLERYRPQANAQSVGLELDAAPMPALQADAGRLEQLLANLISNALRYTPPGGSIRLHIQPEQDGSGRSIARLRLHDSGPGIAPEALPHIFDRFYRADHSRSRAEGGSGLGLAIARQLAQAHGGRLSAENHPGGGAVFILDLPAQTAPR
jgi:two-component system, OmpR family, sensor histidine kinase BaeS